MNEKHPADRPPDYDGWLSAQMIDDGSRLERSCYSDLTTGVVVYESRLYRPDNSLASYGCSFTDKSGNLIIKNQYRRPDESLEFESNLIIDPQVGIPVGDFKTYHSNRVLARHDKNYISKLGRLVLESEFFDFDGSPKPDPKLKQLA